MSRAQMHFVSPYQARAHFFCALRIQNSCLTSAKEASGLWEVNVITWS